ncbi:non-heme iron oxygenase ferredoxin subunit [Patescibacteria group bacterium]|nr:non-heme iron oxygenase ferredoxin subunit [Patescibacteria group bacterium]
MSEVVKAAKLSDLKDGQVKGVKLNGEEIALYRQGNEVFATSDICTHEDCVISENYDVQGEEVECTCHGSHFNIKTGENTVPPAAEPLKTYTTKVEGDDVLIEV